MSASPQLENRKFVIGGIAVGIIIVYLVRLFTLQLLSDDYKKNADSNAFRKEILYPSTATANCSSTTSRPIILW